jgi:hypothetical protein
MRIEKKHFEQYRRTFHHSYSSSKMNVNEIHINNENLRINRDVRLERPTGP